MLFRSGATGYGISAQRDAAKLASQSAKDQAAFNEVQRKSAEQAQGLVQPLRDDVIAPQVAFGKERLARAQAGQLDPAQEAWIEQWKAQKRSEMHDYLARSGQGDSAALVELDAWIDQQALALKSKMLDDEIRQGLTAIQGGGAGFAEAGSILGGSGATAGRGAGGAANQEASLEQMIAAINQQLGRFTAGAA